MELLVKAPPCVLFEDDHLLVVNKPPGWSTHAPDIYAGQGIYDWLRCRERRWAQLAIIHRLDKETSGVLVFSKSREANKSLVAQFEQRKVEKRYLLVTDRFPSKLPLRAETVIARVGERYMSRAGAVGKTAVTEFERSGEACKVNLGSVVKEPPMHGREPQERTAKESFVIVARPLSGKTHQIRVHAAESGFPILGDILYGGTPAGRVFLHCLEIRFNHPETGRMVSFRAPPDFESSPTIQLRRGLVDPEETTAFRVLHGAADSVPGFYADLFGDYLLMESAQSPEPETLEWLAALARSHGARGCAWKQLRRQVRRTGVIEAMPGYAGGEAPPPAFQVLENGLKFEISFQAGYSVGLFLDQRENRRALLTGCLGPGFPLPENGHALNTFSYTCALMRALPSPRELPTPSRAQPGGAVRCL